MSEKDINDFAENRRRYQPSTASTRIRQWWPLLFVLIGLALLVPRFFEFAEEPAWLSIVADVAGLLMILAGLITFTMPRRQDNYRTESIVDTPELQEEYFPFHIANSITEMINILLPEPAGNDNFLSDKDIPYIPRDLPDLMRAFDLTGRVLLRGRSKTGKTRVVIEMLRSYWKTFPTVLVFKRDSKLQIPTFTPDKLPRKNLIVIIDDIHNHAVECKRRKISVGDALSDILDYFVQYCGNQPSEVRFVLITRREPECWDQIDYIQNKNPWVDFELVDLPGLSTADSRQLVLELASLPPSLKISSEVVDNISRSNDGTYYRLILAFRDWRIQSKKEITIQDVSNLQIDLVSAWKYRQLNLFRYKPNLKYVYAALDLARSVGLPAQKELIILLTQFLQYRYTVKMFAWAILVKKWWGRKWEKILDVRLVKYLSNRFSKLTILLISKLYLVIVWPFRILFRLFHIKSMWFRVLWSRLLRGLFWGAAFFIVALPIFALVYMLDKDGGVVVSFFKRSLLSSLGLYIPIFIGLLLYVGVILFVLVDAFIKVFINLQRKVLAQTIKYISATEIPMDRNTLVPYDLQVEGASNNFKSRSWVIGLMESGSMLRKDKNSYEVLKNWFEGADFNEIGWGLGIGLGELLLGSNSKDPTLYKDLGKYKLWTNKHDEALALLQSAIELNPKYGLALYYRGLTYRKMEQYQNALVDFDQAVTLMPLNENVLLDRALTYQKMEQYEKALIDYDKAILLYPIAEYAFRKRGLTYQLMNQHEKALADFDQAIELDPKHTSALFNRAETYRLMEKYEEEIKDLEQAIELDPKDAWAFLQRGHAYRLIKKYEEAIKDFDHVIELDPKSNLAFGSRGEIYRLWEKYEEATKEFSQAIELDPKVSWIFLGRGLVYHSIGKYEDAIKDFDQAIELNPKYALAFGNRGRTHRSMEKYEEAIKDFGQAVELDPKDSWALGIRGDTYLLMKKYEEAIKDFNQAVELDPKDSRAFSSRGLTYLSMEKYEEAIKDFDQAIGLDPKVAWIFGHRGQANRSMEKHEEAIKDFNKAIEIDSTNDWWRYQRSLIYLVNNNLSEANQDLELAIELSDQIYQKSPSDRRNTFNLALYYLAIANHKLSRQLYIDALKEDVSAELKNGAIDDLDNFISLFPKNKHAKAMRKLFE